MTYRLTMWNEQGASDVTDYESEQAAKAALAAYWCDPRNLTAAVDRIEPDDGDEPVEPMRLCAWNGIDWYDTATAQGRP